MLSRGIYGRAVSRASVSLAVAALSGGCDSGSDQATGNATRTEVTATSTPTQSSSTPSTSISNGPLTAPAQYPPAMAGGTASSGSTGGTGNDPTTAPSASPTASAAGGAGESPVDSSDPPAMEPDTDATTSVPVASSDAGADPASEDAATPQMPPQVDGPAVDLSTVSEETLPNLLSVRQEHSVVALDGEIYVIGGYTPQATDSVEAYDPTAMTWRTAPSFPEVMNHGNAGVVDGKIYVAGYYTGGTMSDTTTNVYVYDPMLQEWAAGTPMPQGTERAASCVCVDAGVLYVVAGAKNGMSVDTSSRYDVANDTWEALPPLPERREHCVAGVIDGTLYIAGGRADGITGIQEGTWALDLTAMQWVERAPLSPPRGGLAGAASRGRLFVFGGEGNEHEQSGVFSDVNVYDPVTDSWEALEPMLAPRHGFAAALLDDRIYLAGGADRQGGGAADDNSVFFFEE